MKNSKNLREISIILALHFFNMFPVVNTGFPLGCEQTERQRQRQGERQIGSRWVHCIQVPLTLMLQNGSGTN